MQRIVFKHIRNTDNVGDRWCSPYDYGYFEDALALDLDDPTPLCDAVIYGGGKIFGSLYEKLNVYDKMAKHRIAWGVSTVQSSLFSFRYTRSRQSMTLVGSRDYGDDRYEYAPCMSCMSPLFTQEHREIHDVVFYLHKMKSESLMNSIPNNVPVLDNHCSSMDEAIKFLGSGETVVSNSYHGVYWALLLGKKVICLPFSKKFLFYRLPPTYSDKKNWIKQLSLAKRQKNMLELCKAESIKFENKVRSLIY